MRFADSDHGISRNNLVLLKIMIRKIRYALLLIPCVLFSSCVQRVYTTKIDLESIEPGIEYNEGYKYYLPGTETKTLKTFTLDSSGNYISWSYFNVSSDSIPASSIRFIRKEDKTLTFLTTTSIYLFVFWVYWLFKDFG